jgi:hypothetical protein
MAAQEVLPPEIWAAAAADLPGLLEPEEMAVMVTSLARAEEEEAVAMAVAVQVLRAMRASQALEARAAIIISDLEVVHRQRRAPTAAVAEAHRARSLLPERAVQARTGIRRTAQAEAGAEAPPFKAILRRQRPALCMAAVEEAAQAPVLMPWSALPALKALSSSSILPFL